MTNKKKFAAKVLVADDDATIRGNLALLLRSEGYEVHEASDGTQAIQLVKDQLFDLAVIDLKMPGKTGLQILEECVAELENTPVVVITAFGGSQAAIEAMKLGAFDYITKPFDLDEVLFTVRRAIEQQTLISQVRRLTQRQNPEEQLPADRFLGQTPGMLQVFKTIGRLAKTHETVLILGESGTGKEMVATAIHESSLRANGPFVKVNCAALNPMLLESELFGHERGAFTGAVSQRIGRFEQANGGTLFLDEIGDFDIDLQAKLLRVLQTGEFERVGGSEVVRSDVRVISATNRDLNRMIGENRFREDLLYRLNVVTINLPPLRERKEDIQLLADHFVRDLAEKYGWQELALAPEAIRWLLEQPWPGNVRQLQNTLARGAAMARGRMILTEDLQTTSDMAVIANPDLTSTGPDRRRSLKEILADTEKRLISQALDETNWNRTQAAKILGISRRQLFDKIQQYELEEAN